MNKTLFLLGPSDNEMQNTVSKSPAGPGLEKVEAVLAGVVPILPFIESDQTLRAKIETIVIGIHPVKLRHHGPVNLFNIVGDADASAKMLRAIQMIESKIQPLRCFNRPDNVFRTARARLPETLAGIPGCVLPHVRNAEPKNFDELKNSCKNFDKWPLILRAKGQHGGNEMIMLTELGQLDRYQELPWLYNGICLIEFIDYKNEEGLYQKNRVIMIDGTPYPRHAIFSEHWMIHVRNRSELMPNNRELRVREERFLADGLKSYSHIFQSIYERVGLDVFGIDFALLDGQIVVFEANACMKFLDRQYSGGDHYGYLNDYVRSQKRAIKKMLMRS